MEKKVTGFVSCKMEFSFSKFEFIFKFEIAVLKIVLKITIFWFLSVYWRM